MSNGYVNESDSKLLARGGWKRSRELPRATKINYAKSVF